MLVVGIKLIVRKMGFHKIGCLRQGISNCQCPRNRVSQKLDVYFLGYIIQKVAEITITPKTAQKYSLFWDLHRAILLTQRETLAAHNCEGTEQLHKIIINSILLLTY